MNVYLEQFAYDAHKENITAALEVLSSSSCPASLKASAALLCSDFERIFTSANDSVSIDVQEWENYHGLLQRTIHSLLRAADSSSAFSDQQRACQECAYRFQAAKRCLTEASRRTAARCKMPDAAI